MGFEQVKREFIVVATNYFYNLTYKDEYKDVFMTSLKKCKSECAIMILFTNSDIHSTHYSHLYPIMENQSYYYNWLVNKYNNLRNQIWSYIIRNEDEIENSKELLNRYRNKFPKFHNLNIENEMEIEAHTDIVLSKISKVQRDQKMLREKVGRYY